MGMFDNYPESDVNEEVFMITPGEILKEEFLKEMDISEYRLAKSTGIQATAINQIVKGKRSISAETALKFSRFFGNSAQFWLNLQDQYDLKKAKQKLGAKLELIEQYH